MDFGPHPAWPGAERQAQGLEFVQAIGVVHQVMQAIEDQAHAGLTVHPQHVAEAVAVIVVFQRHARLHGQRQAGEAAAELGARRGFVAVDAAGVDHHHALRPCAQAIQQISQAGHMRQAGGRQRGVVAVEDDAGLRVDRDTHAVTAQQRGRVSQLGLALIHLAGQLRMLGKGQVRGQAAGDAIEVDAHLRQVAQNVAQVGKAHTEVRALPTRRLGRTAVVRA